MSGFEPRIFGVVSNCFTNWATTIAQFFPSFCLDAFGEVKNLDKNVCLTGCLSPNQEAVISVEMMGIKVFQKESG